MNAVYIHIPFCHSICTYCDFCKLYYDESLVKSYLDALEIEINKTYRGELIKTIYIGGGTPSILNNDDLIHLFNTLDVFNKSQLEEFTIECNVTDLNKEKLLLFKKNGINRLSVGVQTFNQKLLKLLDRNHTKEKVKEVIEISKEVGITNISVDMIYGLNDQTIIDLKDDLDTVLSLDIPHISFYSLIIEPHTKLYIEHYPEIDEDLNAKMYDYISRTLKNNNYKHYEISNYAKEGYESKHNLVYWHNEQYYGFGLGASSFVDNKRYENTRNIQGYIKGSFIGNVNTLTKHEMMENEMILGLRLRDGVNKNQFYKKYHEKVNDVFPVDRLIANGLLVDKDNFLYIPEDKIFISNLILLEFID